MGFRTIEDRSLRQPPQSEKAKVDALLDQYDKRARAEGYTKLCLCTVYTLDGATITVRPDITGMGATRFSDDYNGRAYSVVISS